MTNCSLMKVKSKPIFNLFESGRFTLVLPYFKTQAKD